VDACVPSAAKGGPWVLAMGWHDLLFAHWRVPTEVLRPRIPAALEIDDFEGEAWVGVVPFRMSGVRPRFVPSMPGLSWFPELNLRTYVRHEGRAGVWFFSLDAASRVAVRLARATFHLPYFDARMSCTPRDGGGIEYESVRIHRDAPAAVFKGSYRPKGPAFASRPGSLAHWLTERYCLYSADAAGRVYRGDVAHEPWPLQEAEAALERCDMTRLLGWELPGESPHLLFARGIHVRASWPVRMA
jgi:uncharacterized protein YqjF (DUF2071 family)